LGQSGKQPENPLKPIAVAIAWIEGDNAILSDIQTLLADVREEIRIALPTSLLLQAEETAVMKYIEKCENFCLKSIHATAYVLDHNWHWKEHPVWCRDQQSLWCHHYRVASWANEAFGA
jgi:hypothetical protein